MSRLLGALLVIGQLSVTDLENEGAGVGRSRDGRRSLDKHEAGPQNLAGGIGCKTRLHRAGARTGRFRLAARRPRRESAVLSNRIEPWQDPADPSASLLFDMRRFL
jgi:hypothetical protein